MNESSKIGKAAKVISIIAFSLVMTALLTAIISDIAIFSNQIGGFILAIIASAAVFVLGIIFMVMSIMMIFGIILIQNEGFWPMAWCKRTFHEVLADYTVTPSQIEAFKTIRIVLLVICIIVFILAIISSSLARKERKQNSEVKQKLTKSFSSISLAFSILGLVIAIGAIALMNAL